MDVRSLDDLLSVSPQITPQDIPALAAAGFRSVICDRPDGEAADQPSAGSVEAAARGAGLSFRSIPVVASAISDADVAKFRQALDTLPGPVLGYCRTGTRAAMLWALASVDKRPAAELLEGAAKAGYDLGALRPRLEAASRPARAITALSCDVLIIGGGAAGLATAASVLRRRPSCDVTVVEPSATHYYQPGWTMIGGGVFESERTFRPMVDVMPRGVNWIRSAAAGFDPANSEVNLADGRRIRYRALVVATGLKLDWDAIAGLRESLGHHGVTSNYDIKTAPYTWKLVRELKGGKALFTQPPMPIKCAGAPQKAMYLSGSHWFDEGRLADIKIEFHNAGAVLFGVKEYVPALMEYVAKYRAELRFGSHLISVDGPRHEATFAVTSADGKAGEETRSFDMLHVCPPQRPIDVVNDSLLAGEGGWVDVDPATLRHKRYANVFAAGDSSNAPNAKTAAAARKQAPVVAENVVALLDERPLRAQYDGYGSCPLTVERGKIVLAEFGYGGKLMPSFPRWLIDGTKPSRLAWYLKEEVLPELYWKCMLRGREWLCEPALLDEQVMTSTGTGAR
jgi:sulfide:quinone oxidoreductase